MHHRFAWREQAFAVGVARCMRNVAQHVLHNFVGRLQAKGSDIADVEPNDLVALFFHLARFVEHRTSNIVSNVGQFVRLDDGLH